MNTDKICALLKRLEWSVPAQADGEVACPSCWAQRPIEDPGYEVGHEDDCELAKALAELQAGRS